MEFFTGIRLWRSRYPDKSKADYYAVIKAEQVCRLSGLIVEHAYVSNHDDSTTFLNGNDRLKRLGVADATGIAEYFDLILDQAPVLLDTGCKCG